MIQCPSPNFRRMKTPRIVTCIVIHATATSGIDSPKEWLCNPESGVSAHYLIGLDGQTFQLVDENNVAWHAGKSEWGGKKGVNAFSIGIELVNSNDGVCEYPCEQIASCSELVVGICKERGIRPENVVGHADISPGRKTDPAAFPWDDFRINLKEKLP